MEPAKKSTEKRHEMIFRIRSLIHSRKWYLGKRIRGKGHWGKISFDNLDSGKLLGTIFDKPLKTANAMGILL